MDMVYVIYKNNKIYRTGDKNAIYLNEDKVKEVVNFHCKNDAKREYKNKHRNDEGICSFEGLPKDKQNRLIDEVKKNYTIRIFSDGGASISC